MRSLDGQDGADERGEGQHIEAVGGLEEGGRAAVAARRRTVGASPVAASRSIAGQAAVEPGGVATDRAGTEGRVGGAGHRAVGGGHV